MLLLILTSMFWLQGFLYFWIKIWASVAKVWYLMNSDVVYQLVINSQRCFCSFWLQCPSYRAFWMSITKVWYLMNSDVVHQLVINSQRCFCSFWLWCSDYNRRTFTFGQKSGCAKYCKSLILDGCRMMYSVSNRFVINSKRCLFSFWLHCSGNNHRAFTLIWTKSGHLFLQK